MSKDNSGGGCGCLVLIAILVGIGYHYSGSNNGNKTTANTPVKSVVSSEKTESTKADPSITTLRDKLYNNWSQSPHESDFEYLYDLAELVDSGYKLANSDKKSEQRKYANTVFYYTHMVDNKIIAKLNTISLEEFRQRAVESDSGIDDEYAEYLYTSLKESGSGAMEDMYASGEGMGLALQFSAFGKSYLENTSLKSETPLSEESLKAAVIGEDSELMVSIAHILNIPPEEYIPKRGYELEFEDGQKIYTYNIGNAWAFVSY